MRAGHGQQRYLKPSKNEVLVLNSLKHEEKKNKFITTFDIKNKAMPTSSTY